jgi:hypothetical protein
MDLLEFIQEKLKAMHVISSKTPWILGCFFQKNEEQTNMNITFNKSPIPAAGKEKLTPAEEGPGCQEGHGQAPSTRADLQASWLCTPSKCSMTHASRFQV